MSTVGTCAYSNVSSYSGSNSAFRAESRLEDKQDNRTTQPTSVEKAATDRVTLSPEARALAQADQVDKINNDAKPRPTKTTTQDEPRQNNPPQNNRQQGKEGPANNLVAKFEDIARIR